ncbi:hypothetical protein C8Q72DRAFT_447939 [Fomitopsis betulina]|nr:hypothetical protein C8Q72DRAFT_447939 [Fomitopsis betulina]
MTRLLGLRVAPMISLDRPLSRLADSECRSSGASPMIVILLQYPVATRCGADARSDSQLLKSWPPEIQNAPSSPQQLLHSTSGNMHLTATFILLACVLLQAVNGIPTPTVDEQTLSHKGGTALDTSFSALDDVGGSRESDLVLSSDSYGLGKGLALEKRFCDFYFPPYDYDELPGDTIAERAAPCGPFPT